MNEPLEIAVEKNDMCILVGILEYSIENIFYKRYTNIYNLKLKKKI